MAFSDGAKFLVGRMVSIAVCSALFITVGCVPTPSSPPRTSTSGVPAGSGTIWSATTGSGTVANPAAFSDTEQEPVEETPQVAVVDNAAPQADTTSLPVTLGDPSLTAGIPGEGDLRVDEIKNWLARPGIHFELEVKLPKGLSLAEANITGIKENPMTRAKIELGRQLYFDTRLSADNLISCSSCHSPDTGFARHTQFGVGIDSQMGDRNTPISYNRIISSAQFWDGRAASLEAQAVGPIANPIEMGNTHEQVVKTLAGIKGYSIQFEAVFGDEGVTIDNVGKALATFERAIVSGPSPYDYYEDLRKFLVAYPEQEDIDELKEDDPELFVIYEKARVASAAHPISESAIRGRGLFFDEKKTNCTACHAGANFTDEKYHNLGIGMDAKDPDLGRSRITKKDKDTGAFKTPTVRNVALSAPYMHDGSLKTLEAVIEWYAKGGGPNKHLSDKIKKLDLTKQDKADLVAFMKACTGPFPKVNRARRPE